MGDRVSPPGEERTRKIFMPLATDTPRGPAAEDKDYRPVEAEWLGGDTYRVVSAQPKNERWEYPSGARVFAVKLHPGDAVIVIVAPFPQSEAAPADEPAGESGRPRGRSAPVIPWKNVQIARLAQMVVVLIVMVTTASAWSRRDAYGLQPADPLRASVVATSLILIAGLWRASDARELRALRTPSIIVAGAFVLCLILERCQA